MTPSPRLAASLEAYRIGDPSGRWPVFSPEGARQVSGRWHERGDRVIYASEHYSTAMLEMLARWNGPAPGNQHFIRIEIPRGTTYEIIEPEDLPGWHSPGSPAARKAGYDWYTRGESAILLVPSVVARMDRNVLINADHLDFSRFRPGPETAVWCDDRLFL